MIAVAGKNTLSKRQRHNALISQLKQERTSFESHWKDLADYGAPRRARFFTADANRGDRRAQKIIDSTATLALRTLRSGMMAGVTSPARDWKRLTTPDPELAEVQSVKEWLSIVNQRISTVFLRSNIYNVLPVIYGDMGQFGTAAMSLEEDFEHVIRAYPFPIGSYWIAQDERLRVTVFYREFQMTVRQLIARFGKVGPDGKPNWSNFSNTVRSAWDNGNYETRIDVCHLIEPNPEYSDKGILSKYKKYSSCYFEKGTSEREGAYLSEKGYDYFPVLVPRWETSGEDTYGTSCPGMEALGDVRQLQLGEKKAAKAIDKMIDPPMVGPTSMKNQKASILPADITYLDAREGMQGFRPAHEVNFRLEALEAKQEQVRRRIQRAYYEDLFLMLANDTRSNITAREIQERHEEKLLALGPVLEQLNQDLLDPLIDNTFAVMVAQSLDANGNPMEGGLIPPIPEELQGMDLKVEYVSIMAQAQKLVGLSGMERFVGFVGQVATFDPSAIQKVNSDQLLEDYGEAVGLSPKSLRTEDEVGSMRQAQQQAAEAERASANIQQGAAAARDLSQADVEGDNALTRLINQANAGNLAGGP